MFTWIIEGTNLTGLASQALAHVAFPSAPQAMKPQNVPIGGSILPVYPIANRQLQLTFAKGQDETSIKAVI